MGYRISYTAKGVQKKVSRKIIIPPWLSISLSVITLLIIGYFTFSGNLDNTIHMLFPWTEPHIRSAILKLESSVQEGKPLFDAITVFCKEIINAAPI